MTRKTKISVKYLDEFSSYFKSFKDKIEESCEILSYFMTMVGNPEDSQVCQQSLNPPAYQFKDFNTANVSKMEICCVLNKYYQLGLNETLDRPVRDMRTSGIWNL